MELFLLFITLNTMLPLGILFLFDTEAERIAFITVSILTTFIQSLIICGLIRFLGWL